MFGFGGGNQFLDFLLFFLINLSVDSEFQVFTKVRVVASACSFMRWQRVEL